MGGFWTFRHLIQLSQCQRRHDTQHNDIQLNNTRYNDNQHNNNKKLPLSAL